MIRRNGKFLIADPVSSEFKAEPCDIPSEAVVAPPADQVLVPSAPRVEDPPRLPTTPDPTPQASPVRPSETVRSSARLARKPKINYKNPTRAYT